MKTPSFILSVLLLLFSQEAIATRYSYDESGNVVSRRDIGYASHKAAKNITFFVMEDLEFYKKWCDIIIDYEITIKLQEKNLIDKDVNCSDDVNLKNYQDETLSELYNIKERISKAYTKKSKSFLKRAFRDFNEFCIESNYYLDPTLNARLRAACGKDLRDLDKKRLEKVKKVEDRGYIKTDSEFYLIRNHIDYLEATNATDEEIIKFDTLITLYEEKIKEKMERQRKKQL